MCQLPTVTTSTTRVFSRIGLNSTRARLFALFILIALLNTLAFSASWRGSPRQLFFPFSRPTITAGGALDNLNATSGNRLEGSLIVARAGHTATVLENGRVLVVGGENQNGLVTEAEIFDPLTGGFSSSGNLSVPRADHSATRLPDGRVLIAGGRGELGSLNSTEIFDPASGVFTSGPNLNSARSGHSATALADGRIVFAGGDAAGSLEILDVAAGTSANAGAMSGARSMHGAALILDGRILFAGGSDAGGNALSSGEIFNPADGSCSNVDSSLTVARVRPHLRVLFDGKVQIIGGSDDGSLEVYDPQINAFGAYVHVAPEGDTCAGLPGQIQGSQTRAALFHNGQSDATYDRSRHTMTDLGIQAVVIGGANSGGDALNSVPVFNSSGAEISADKLDYSPGETAHISGRGFEPGETVRIKVHEDPHTPLERGLDILADNEGNFVGTYLVQAYDLHMKFLVGARGLSSGRTAQTSFTDDIPPTKSLTTLGTAVCQDFNTLASTGTSSTAPDGWTFAESGTSANTTYTAGTGSSTTGETYSFGSAGHSERAFGGLRSAGLISTIGAAFTNNSGQTITSLVISYTGEHWRLGTAARADRLDFQYSLNATSLSSGSWTDVNELDFSSPTTTVTGAKDGNLAANRTAMLFTITGLNIPNGSDFWIRWTDFDASSADDGLAVDDFCLTPQAEPDVTVAVSPSAVDEDGATNLAYTFTRSNTSGGALAVNFSVGGDATFDTDYTESGADTFSSSAGTVTFAAGDSTATVTINPSVDTTFEPAETVILTVTSGAGYDVGSSSSATGTINNDDSVPTVQFASASSSGDESTNPVNLQVTLSNATYQTVTVDYSVNVASTATDGGVDFTLVAGSLTFNASDTSKNISLTVTNDVLDEADETVGVDLNSSVNANLGSPSSHTYTIQDNDAEPTVQFAASSSSGAESSGANLEVTLSATSGKTVMVSFAAMGGSATGGGTDYTLSTGILTFAPGDTSENVSIGVNNDALDEDDETVAVDLSSPSNATLGVPFSHTYTIEDTDAPPTVQFASPSSSGGESAAPVNLEVALSAESGKTVSVNYEVNGGSTANGGGVDYTLAAGMLTFNPGDTNKNISLTVNNDDLHEEDEMLIVDLTSSVNANLGSPSSHTYTIQDNDAPPSFSTNDVSLTEGDAGTKDLIFTVTKTGATALTATVDYMTADGAVNPATGGASCGTGVDYESLVGTLTFGPSDTMKTVTVKICGDTGNEANETFLVNLSNAGNANISDAQGTGTIINDDGAVNYVFQGFFAPIDNQPAMNTTKAGSSVPVKWRLTNQDGAPISDPSSLVGVFSYLVACGSTDGLETPVETTAPGDSSLKYLGDGYWQINWKTPGSYPKGSCRVLELRLNDGTSYFANFKFK